MKKLNYYFTIFRVYIDFGIENFMTFFIEATIVFIQAIISNTKSTHSLIKEKVSLYLK